MKKIFLFALCAIFASSAFAEGFSIQQLKKIIASDLNVAYKYAYESEISSESNSKHMTFYFAYYLNNVNKQATVAEILKEAEKFKVIKEQDYLYGLGITYATANHIDQALNVYKKQPLPSILDRIRRVLIRNKQYDKAYEVANKYDASMGFDVAKSEKNYVKAWQYGVKALTVTGGYNKPSKCTEIIHYMFRYKPASVTKEQQIEFLTKLSQIYPIPGTDFNQWKSFMGFVGFKYKQLTGKDLF